MFNNNSNTENKLLKEQTKKEKRKIKEFKSVAATKEFVS